MALIDGLNLLARTAAAAQHAPPPTRTLWATVVAVGAPVWVRLDGDTSSRPVSDNTAGPVTTGRRVRVEHRGMRLTIVGKPQHPEETS